MSHSPRQITEQLKKTYRTIAKDFSDSRSAPWPEFKLFAKYIPDESKVLDLGCGNGRLYQYLVKDKHLHVDYTGVDFCPEFLSIAKERYPKASFLEQEIAHLNINRRFDRILCIAAFHHLPSKALRKKALQKISEHLEADGFFLLSVWNLWQMKYWKQHMSAFFSWIFSFLRSDPRGLMIPFGKEKVKRYYHAFYPFELKRLLNKEGFQVDHFSVSRHNYLFVCHKRLAKAVSDPVRISSLGKNINPSAIATCK